jgi:fructose-specific phosphotransferase system IIC component
MEPSDLNLNDSDNEDAALKAMMRAQSPALPDDGFSQRVLAALPAVKAGLVTARRRGSSWTWLAYVGGGIVGTSFAAIRVGNWSKLVHDAAQLPDSLAPAAPAFTEPWVSVALALCVFSLAIAWPFYRLDSGR